MSANIDAVLARLDEMNNGEINYEVYRELHDLVSAIEDDVQAPIELFPGTLEALDALSIRARTTSPDAATELAQLMAERDAGKQAEADRAYLYQLGLKLGAERDAALASIERIREAVSGHPECDRYSEDDVISCGWKSAYASVVAALDGAPEPEWEWEYRRVRPDGVPVFNAVFETMPLLDDYYTAEYRKVSAWLPVEGEKRES